ncbi:MAG: ribosome small subunit-dependent GTPase A [Magnetococcales bacterium]|nr:ribosome small subunit-dependent GTPase A [Magnetococcales bacterium]
MPRKKSSRSLNHRQRERIRKIQQQRVDRLSEKRTQELDQILDGQLGEEEEGLVIAHYGLNVEVSDAQGTRFRCAVRETVPENPVCGDRVVWQRGERSQGVVVALHARRSVLRRPAAYQRLQTLAANVERMVVITSADQFNPGLVDRYLVAAGVTGISPIIVVNKVDLPHDAEALTVAIMPYQRMGYALFQVSALEKRGLNELKAALGGHIAVFVGHSGVGKSSLISFWEACHTIKVGEVNPETGKGRHTTTVARLYPFPEGGGLIDSPGIRTFGLHGVSREEVPHHFKDIAPHLGRCRFSNCSHLHEPGCGVSAAVEAGEIHPPRLESLHRILDSLPK